MIKYIFLTAVCLMISASVVIAEEDVSSADLVQFAVSMMGDSNQEAQVSDFDMADSRQIGYSLDGNVTQVISYDNIGNGSAIQWGESGDMSRKERSWNLDSVGDEGITWQWSESGSYGDVNQTINVKNSRNLYLKQIIGGLKNVIFPDPNGHYQTGGEMESNNWWFCGKSANGTGGLPLCAEKMAKRIMDGKAAPRDYYMLQVLAEDYYVYPPENSTPHVTLTKWNISNGNGNLTIKFKAQNFGRNTYNATLKLDLMPRISISGLDENTENIQSKGNVVQLKSDWDIKVPEMKTVEAGKYRVAPLKMVEDEIVVPLNGMKIKNLQLRMISE